ncbi:restriction endonuclease subunit S [Pedobacter sp. SG918]|uniref:restriction endonuclease subunit S n=1 Tax=Pedobacter sp. SG918 TaxID=2587136 RepID=UPI00146E0B73|nr:restriction endonuclease subunit S [Pedobacter sp. SG918]NMN36090.1 type I restriction enzyme S subunit [Pedobacter sp. SG918]
MRFKGFEGEWKQRTLADLGDFIGGGTPSSSNSNFWNGDIPWVSSSDLEEDSIHSINVSRYITNEAINKSSTKFCKAPVILIVSRVGVGKVAYSNKNICTSQDFTNIVNFKCNGLFLTYFLSIEMKNSASSMQGTSIKGISSTEIKSKKLFIPLNNEQQKIASFLSLIDERILTQSKIIDNLQSQIKELAKKMFSQQMNLKDDNGINFPEWESRFGNEIFNNISNKNHNSDLPILAITQEHGAIPRNLIEYQISVTDKSIDSYKVVEVGDFIISLRSFQGGIEYSSYKGICSPAYIILRAKTDIDNRFYKYYLKTEKYIKSLNEKLEGIRDGKMISYKYFSDISLPYPSLTEQNKISDIFSLFEKKIELEKQLLLKYESQKKHLLQNLFI